MAEVKAAVNPDAILRDGHIFLGIYRPLSRKGNLLVERGVHLQAVGALLVKRVKGGQGGAAETTNYMRVGRKGSEGLVENSRSPEIRASAFSSLPTLSSASNL
jgi:hypothetical protein